MGMTPWGKVGNTWKEVTALWGKINGAWQLLEEANNEPYNQALALVGIDKVDSLSVVLTNSSYCTKLAGNAEAYGIMKANYSSDMTSTIDSNWNEGLNLLNYKCRLTCYLLHGGNECTNITGGFTYQDQYTYNNGGGIYNIDTGGWNGRSFYSTNKVSTNGYSTLSLYSAYCDDRGQWCRYGLSNSTEKNWDNFEVFNTVQDVVNGGWLSVNIKDYNSSYHFKHCVYYFAMTVTNIKLTP